MCSLTIECVLLLQNVFSYNRMCSLTLECVLLHGITAVTQAQASLSNSRIPKVLVCVCVCVCVHSCAYVCVGVFVCTHKYMHEMREATFVAEPYAL